MSHEEFIEIVKDAIYGDCIDGRIIPSILIAHAAVSSKWGQSDIALKANNLYNVTCTPHLVERSYDVNNASQTASGKTIETTMHYRMYSSWSESICDYITRLTIKPKFQVLSTIESVSSCITIYSQLIDMSNASKLATRLTQVIEEYKLTQYDYKRGRYNPYNIAQIGDKGEVVKWLQYELMCLGYRIDGSFITSFFDYPTMLAVKEYQEDHDLDISGVVDLKTFKTLTSTPAQNLRKD